MLRYHKNLTRERVASFSWQTQLQMVASEFSRLISLEKNGGGSEMKGCMMRAKELLGVLESDAKIPPSKGKAVLAVIKKISLNGKPLNFKQLYKTCANV